MSEKTVEINGVVYDKITLDFETAYDDEYSLSKKYNYTEYVRDPRFTIHGVAIKLGDTPSLWYTGRNVARAIAAIDWKKSLLVAHNTMFDGFILHEIFGVHPVFYGDTLCAGRGAYGVSRTMNLNDLAKRFGLKGKVRKAALVNTKGKFKLTEAELRALGAYACDDTDDCAEIFDQVIPYLSDDELRLIHITLSMFCDPVLKLDEALVREELEEEIGNKIGKMMVTGTTAEILSSTEKFTNLLLSKGVHPHTLPMKKSPTTGLSVPAYAKNDLEFVHFMSTASPEIRAICEARLLVKSNIGETRAQRFLNTGANGQLFPIGLNYSLAHTFRWTGGNKMNPQNLKRGNRLRRSLLAPEGYMVVVADSAQIEARVLAWLADQFDISEAFRLGEDVYKKMAASLFNIPIEQVTKDQRFLGKVCVLGLGYGMGPEKLMNTLAKGALGGPPVIITYQEAVQLVNAYRTTCAAITRFWDFLTYRLADMKLGVPSIYKCIEFGKEFIRLPNGLYMRYEELDGTLTPLSIKGETKLRLNDAEYTSRFTAKSRIRTRIYGGLLTENIVQALSRVIIGEQMLKIHDLGYKIVTMTHDEIVIIAKKKQAAKAYKDMLKIMSTSPAWAPGLVLSADGGYDVCYSK